MRTRSTVRQSVASPVAAALLAAVVGSLIPACAKEPPVFEEVAPADELFAEGERLLEGDKLLWVIPRVKYAEAIETFQTIIDNYPYSDYAVRAELAIADAYFDQEKFEEALSYYRDFSDLHPQHPKVPYTIYRSALCHEQRTFSHYRDQTPTRDALVYLEELLTRYPGSEFSSDAEEIWRELRLKLARQTLGIADFYRKRKEYEAASKRYQAVLNNYPGLGLDAEALFQLGACHVAMNQPEEARRIFEAIIQNYGDDDHAGDAADELEDLERAQAS